MSAYPPPLIETPFHRAQGQRRAGEKQPQRPARPGRIGRRQCRQPESSGTIFAPGRSAVIQLGQGQRGRHFRGGVHRGDRVQRLPQLRPVAGPTGARPSASARRRGSPSGRSRSGRRSIARPPLWPPPSCAALASPAALSTTSTMCSGRDQRGSARATTTSARISKLHGRGGRVSPAPPALPEPPLGKDPVPEHGRLAGSRGPRTARRYRATTARAISPQSSAMGWAKFIVPESPSARFRPPASSRRLPRARMPRRPQYCRKSS